MTKDKDEKPVKMVGDTVWTKECPTRIIKVKKSDKED